MGYSTIFFDLDDTLYPSSTGLWMAIRNRMLEYLRQHLDLPELEINHLRHHYFTTYGTTLRGLQIHHNVDTEDYLSFVHDVPVENYLKPNPELRAMLLSLTQKKWVFTNADRQHAARILDTLHVGQCFDGIIDVKGMEYHCKPETIAYQYAIQLARVSNPEECVYLDDAIRNLEPAHKLGFLPIMVGEDEGQSIPYRRIGNILELPEVVPELWVNAR
jgi:putative hydrolase of the HAD superfamily